MRTLSFEGREWKVLLFRKGVAPSLKPETWTDKQFDELLTGDYQSRVEMLGKDFKGAAVTVLALHGNVLRVITELIDHPLAASVLNPGR